MRTRRWLVVLGLIAGGLYWGMGQGFANSKTGDMPKMRSTTQKQRKAAAANRKAAGATALATTALVQGPGGFLVPDYFGPYSNWANSPLPGAPVAAVSLTSGGTGYCDTPTVTITDLYGIGTGATASALVSGGVVQSPITFTGGAGYVYPVVTISDCPGGTGTGASATATVNAAGPFTGGLHKFIDNLPDLKALIAKPDTVTFPGTDYYEIRVIEDSSWSFHADLGGNTTLRVYQQTNNGTNQGLLPCTPLPACANTLAPPAVSYLGPVIVATKDRPTRIKFTNALPTTGNGGDLFIPTDTSVMGAGPGYDPASNSIGTYPQNRATLHLHGGFTPWVSDGTPHQWVTPPGEGGVLTTGVSTQPVPDMPVPPGSSMTFYWTNQQSGRLMFYHDHAYGITRLNVYAGEAAGYLLRDDAETALEAAGVIPGLADNIPLVIQDKSFVWGAANATPGLAGSGTWATDPTWAAPWGQAAGSLWYPHVYMPNQNPWDVSGANAMGRWDYALWFWPPFTGLLAHGTVPNPYAANPGEPPEIPGTPNPSLVPEAFMDTPVVNGKAYPVLNVDPKAYRFRILNAANDRFWNLSLLVAADKNSPTTAGTTGAVPCTGGPAAPNCTEVAMVPAVPSSAYPFPTDWSTPSDGGSVRPDILDGRVGGVPDPRYLGPDWIQIGTEGGLLPAPVVIPPSPIGYQYNPRNIVIGNVTKHSLYLGPAERADVIVDFSAFAGQTLIVYNDSPAPVPAIDSRIDYYTGDVDQTDTGGAPTTVPGFGPNTRTVMQIQVGTTNPTPFNVGNLVAAFAKTGQAVFETSQDPILVPQAAYNTAYGTAYTDAMGKNLSRIQSTSLTFPPLGQPDAGPNVTLNLGPKAIQELFELDYGRMNATLGVELPFTNGGNQTTLPMGYIEPPTEIINTSGVTATPVSLAGDGTQLWKITHNGVDTHAIHVHLFNAQVVNRVGWDGAIRPPDANELGWKETIKMSPLEDIIIALRPTTPKLPFGLPNSVRLMSPADAPGTLINTFDTSTGNPMTVANALYNFGWEYVWHCHLLGHEENDMMRPTVFNVPSVLPAAPVLSVARNGNAVLTWTDGTPINYASLATDPNLGSAANEIGFLIQRAPIAKSGKPGAYVQIGTALANATTFTDTTAGTTTTWSYIVVAYNVAGNSPSAPFLALAPPAAPTNMVATLQTGPQIRLTWTDNSGSEQTFAIERNVNGAGYVSLTSVLANVVTFTDTQVTPNNTYQYRVRAVNAVGSSAYATSSPVVVPQPPAAPASFTIVAARASGSNDRVTLTWTNVLSETGYTIQRANNAAFTGATSFTAAANTTSLVQTVGRGLTFYYRIRADNLGGSSAWVNSVPAFVVTP